MKKPTKSPGGNISAFERHLTKLRQKHMFNDDYLRIYLKLDMMYNQCRATEFILRVLTGIKDLKLKELHPQDELASFSGKRVILDAHCIDSKNRDIDIEVQTVATLKELLKRVRLYQGMMDANALKRGVKTSKLTESYIIFVTAKDLLGLGWNFYEKESSFKGTGIACYDGSHVILVNGAYNGDDEHGKLMHDFWCPDPDLMNQTPLKTVAELMKKPQGEERMSDIFKDIYDEVGEEARAEGRAEGREEGRKEGRTEGRKEEQLKMAGLVRNVMNANHWTLDKTLEFLHLSQEDGKSLMALL